MPLRDMDDEGIATAMLKALRDKGLRGLREMEAVAPVSRTTLGAWLNGRYDMKGPTRKKCLGWLGHVTVSAQEPITEGQEKLIAAKWMDLMATRLREEALANQPNASTAPIDVVARISPPRAKRAKRRSGAKEDR